MRCFRRVRDGLFAGQCCLRYNSLLFHLPSTYGVRALLAVNHNLGRAPLLAHVLLFLSWLALKSELRSVAELYGKERGTNASLLSKIRALKGNIEVR